MGRCGTKSVGTKLRSSGLTIYSYESLSSILLKIFSFREFIFSKLKLVKITLNITCFETFK